ncbi:aminotransferase class V-fold PLP-dependent enzyme [Salinimicrobium soli]|uniref:aminotransferase class V-fold PLP-dependent enzyme n=1 Tax=Salinimicrobium soli TaxID=1254399 RepID=UPI003AAAD892
MIKSLFKKRTSAEKGTELAHDAFFESLRTKDYDRLDKNDHVYLDYTGGNLYSTSQLKTHYKLLSENTFGNPHSTNPTSRFSTHLVEEARKKVIDFFNAEDYYCVFTANASGALKIVGECYAFNKDGHFLLFADNHNSVNGIREYCHHAGGTHEYVPMNHDDLSVSEEVLIRKLRETEKKNKLFAYPAQSNVSGIKHDLKWIGEAQKMGWDVLLDAAAYVPTSQLDLKEHQPDFVSISFYKIFGYPTGIGCLFIKKTSFSKLEKKWFAGGTVSLASAAAPFHFLTNNHERFENGTINYLDIPALKIGLDYIESIGMDRINERIASLMNYLYPKLKELRHSTGERQLDIFGHPERKNTGGTMIMCFKNPDGSKIDFEKVEELANDKRISVRSGCFCNPGLDETTNCITNEEMTRYFTSRKTGDYKDMISYLHKMRGATRISVGLATTKNDLDAYISFVQSLKDKTYS